MTPDAESAPFDVTITHDGEDVTVLSVRGEVDLSTAPRLSAAVDAVVTGDPTTCVIIDLTQVPFFASAGMTVLIDAHERTSQHGSFAVVADGPNTARPLTLVGLDQVFAIHSDLDTAIEAVRTDHT